MKRILFVVCLFVVGFLNAQSKKEQIEILTYRVDSLNRVVGEQKEIINVQLKQIENIQTNNITLQKNNSDLRKEVDREKIIYDCSMALNNSKNKYSWRISGELNGCIGCDDITPSDADLHKAILSLKKDYNDDDTIGVEDLIFAIKEAGDINNDEKVNLYDLIFTEKLIYVEDIVNPKILIDTSDQIVELSGIISEDQTRIALSFPIEIKKLNMGEGDEEFSILQKMELYLNDLPELSLYKNRRVILKGKIVSGATQAYVDGIIFYIEEIKGVVSKPSTNSKNNENSDYIVFLRQGSLWKINLDGSDEKLILKNGKIVSFTVSKNYIYYSSISKMGLEIYKLDMDNVSSFVYLLKHELSTQNPSIEDVNQYFNGNDEATMVLINENELLISADYNEDWFQFRKNYIVNIFKKESVQSSDENFRPSDYLEIKWQTTNEKSSNFMAKKFSKEYELFIFKNNQSIKLTNTQQYSPRECWDEIVDYYNYYYTPSGKVLFKFIESCGDISHSIVGIVNDDGSFQEIIDENDISNYSDRQIVYSEKSDSFIFMSEEGLCVTKGKENRKIKLTSDIEGFKLYRIN